MYQKNLMIGKKKSKISMTNKSLNIYKIIMSYCLKCRKNTESKNPKVLKTKKGRLIDAFIKVFIV